MQRGGWKPRRGRFLHYNSTRPAGRPAERACSTACFAHRWTETAEPFVLCRLTGDGGVTTRPGSQQGIGAPPKMHACMDNCRKSAPPEGLHESRQVLHPRWRCLPGSRCSGTDRSVRLADDQDCCHSGQGVSPGESIFPPAIVLTRHYRSGTDRRNLLVLRHPGLKLNIPAQLFCMNWCPDFEFRRIYCRRHG